jgi:hypothetical protein
VSAEQTPPAGAAAIAVTGVWVRRDFAHLGGELTVLVEIDGQWRRLGTWGAEGVISHIFEPAGIRDAPVDRIAEGFR